MGLLKQLNELETDKRLLQHQIDVLTESTDTMRKRIDKIADATAGIQYGDVARVYMGMGLYRPDRSEKSLSDVVALLLAHLKLKIIDTTAIASETKLVKIKPIKPL